MEPYQQWYRWVMLALLWLLYTTFGLVSRAIAPLITPILEDLNLSFTQMGLILGSWPLTYIAVAVMAGTIIDKLGIHKSLFIGIIIIGLSAVLRYFPNGFVTMWLVVALFGIGGPMISIGCPKTVSLWFRGRERRTAVGIYTTGPRAGVLLAFTVTNSLVMPLTRYSWRLTFVGYGLLTFAIALVWWFLARDTKPTGDTESNGITEVFSGLIKVRNVQVALIMGFLSFAIVQGFIDWLPKILETSGLAPAQAGFAASIPLVASLPAVLVITHLAPPHLRGRLIALLALVLAISQLVVVTISGVPQLVGLLLFGMVAYSFAPLIMLILMETPEVGSRYVGSVGGMFFCVASIGGFMGPLIMGALVDMTGAFRAGASFFTILGLLILPTTLLLKTCPYPEASS